MAKAFIGDQAGVSLSHSPTLSMAATQAGVVLGTAGYMSPEQASGEVADHRTDIWAFGVVLVEMLSGRSLFSGKTVTHVLASVMKEDPDWDALPASLDPRILFLLERCLAKEPRERCQTIGEARAELVRESAGVTAGRERREIAALHAGPSSRAAAAWVGVIGLAALGSGPDPRPIPRHTDAGDRRCPRRGSGGATGRRRPELVQGARGARATSVRLLVAVLRVTRIG